ncbi:MAG: VOC family protein, partial [Candidatus Bathyarchaeia archaeon]
KKNDANQRPVNYISVESVEEFNKKISQLGGKLVVPKTEVPGRGFLAVAIDPEGNPFGIWESTQK